MFIVIKCRNLTGKEVTDHINNICSNGQSFWDTKSHLDFLEATRSTYFITTIDRAVSTKKTNTTCFLDYLIQNTLVRAVFVIQIRSNRNAARTNGLISFLQMISLRRETAIIDLFWNGGGIETMDGVKLSKNDGGIESHLSETCGLFLSPEVNHLVEVKGYSVVGVIRNVKSANVVTVECITPRNIGGTIVDVSVSDLVYIDGDKLCIYPDYRWCFLMFDIINEGSDVDSEDVWQLITVMMEMLYAEDMRVGFNSGGSEEMQNEFKLLNVKVSKKRIRRKHHVKQEKDTEKGLWQIRDHTFNKYSAIGYLNKDARQ
eukprot:120036_1